MEQKYKAGDRVRICRIGWPMWEGGKVYDSKPQDVGKLATVVGSYEDQYPRNKNNDRYFPIPKPSYTLNIDGHGEVSWYHEYQMEMADTDDPCTETYPSWLESETGKKIAQMSKDIENEIMWGKPKTEDNGTD